jgi:hypothetical protein
MKMQNKIIIYEPIELQDETSIEDLELYQAIKTIKNIEVFISFYE